MAVSLDSQVKKMISENPDFKRYMGNEDLKNRLYGTLARRYEKNRYFLKGAKFIDRAKQWINAGKLSIDAALGHIPIIGPTVMYPIRGVATLAEMMVELPYMAYYTMKTRLRSLGTTGAGLVRGALQYMPSIPGTIGDVAGMVPIYQRGALKYLRKDAARDFRAYLKNAKPSGAAAAVEAGRKKKKSLTEIVGAGGGLQGQPAFG